MAVRMTQYAAGGGCACKVPIGELERLLAGVDLPGGPQLLVGADGDDAAVVRLDAGRAVVSTADFFTPVVDDPFDWGRIVAANAMSDVWAMGGECVLAINLVGWPRAVLDLDLLARGAPRRSGRRPRGGLPGRRRPHASTPRSRCTGWR